MTVTASQIKPRSQHASPPKPDNRNKAVRRRDYRTANPTCQVCHTARSEHVHEIASGPARHLGETDQDVQLAVCGECHDSLHDKLDWPLERQIVLRLRVVIRKINRYRGRGPRAITLKDLIPYMNLED